MNDSEIIAAGGTPTWSGTLRHREHGELTFRVTRLPDVSAYLRMAALQEELAPGVTQGTGALLAEASAAIVTFMDRPVIREERVVDPDDPTHERITKHYYDPMGDQDFQFPIAVYALFMAWRQDLLSPESKEQVKNSSGATDTSSTGNATVAPSPAATESPLSTSASES